MERLRDEDASVRQAAASSLGLFGSAAKEAIPALRESGERDLKLKDAVQEALRKIEGR